MLVSNEGLRFVSFNNSFIFYFVLIVLIVHINALLHSTYYLTQYMEVVSMYILVALYQFYLTL